MDGSILLLVNFHPLLQNSSLLRLASTRCWQICKRAARSTDRLQCHRRDRRGRVHAEHRPRCRPIRRTVRVRVPSRVQPGSLFADATVAKLVVAAIGVDPHEFRERCRTGCSCGTARSAKRPAVTDIGPDVAGGFVSLAGSARSCRRHGARRSAFHP